MTSSTLSTPTQRALQIPEVVRLILSHIDDKATAVNCSCVCRLWRHPALDAYWRRLEDEDDLARLLLPQLQATKELVTMASHNLT